MRIYEMIGSIVILATLFASVGVPFSFNDSVSLYSANESSGNLTDSIGWIGDLQEYGTVQNQTGLISGARGAYSGSDYFSKSGLSLWNTSDSFTVAMWVMPTTSTPTGRQIFVETNTGGGGAYIFYLHWAEDLGGIRFATAPSGSPYLCDIVQPLTVTANNWYFVAGGYNASIDTCYLYVNNTVSNASQGGAVSDRSTQRILRY
jgi:hypothetical protein